MTIPINNLCCSLLLCALATGGQADAAEARQDAWNGVLKLRAATGLGYDSNVFYAPARPYTDYAQSSQPLVSPREKSGFFVPLELKAELLYSANETNLLYGQLDYNAQQFTDPDLDNADQHDYQLRLGDRLRFGEKRKSWLDVAAFHGVRDRIYTDHDTGLKKETLNGSDVSNRYNYRKSGVKFDAKYKTGNYIFDYYLTNQTRNYDDPGIVSQLDHDYFKTSLAGSYRHAGGLKLTLGYSYFVYDYKERPSHDLTGRLTTGNPPVKYIYDRLTIKLQQRFNRKWKASLTSKYTWRSDDYLGYNDYSEQDHELKVRYRLLQDIETRLGLSIWQRQYPNAFAYDSVFQDRTRYHGTSYEFELNITLRKIDKLGFYLQRETVNSNDKRYGYEKYVLGTNYQWNFRLPGE